MKTYSSYDLFVKDVQTHLEQYNEWGVGDFKGHPKKHIAKLSGKTQSDIINDIILSDNVDPDLFVSPQQFAHHLNSSQIVCYEFFRPMLSPDKEKTITSSMLKCLNKMGLPFNEFKGGHAEFEWIPDSEENTNFDFYISGQNQLKRIYFEIKYTERYFGNCKDDDNHRNKFESIYSEMIDNCACLSKKPSFEEFKRNYQLFRNALRVTHANWQNEYVIFLFPRENCSTLNHYNAFVNEFLDKDYLCHVKSVFWENLIDFMSDRFREKFFFYTI